MSSALARDLGAALDGTVLTEPAALVAYTRDQALFTPAGVPAAAVFPTTTAEVVRVVEVARRHAKPLVPRGAGSGLAGGANAVDDAIIVVFDRMDRILDVDRLEQTATVQPGVLNAALAERAAASDLWYPPDPASAAFCTIGGNLATNAGGLCCVKYGVTRESVLGLEVVLADGEVVRVGRRTVKGVAGYDLVGLFVGSEGTLGLITEATLRLRRAPPTAATLVASFPHLSSIGRAVALAVEVASPSLLEVVDRTTIRAIERWKRMSLDTDAAGLVIAQSDLPGDLGRVEIDRLAAACEQAGADLVVMSTDPDEAQLLLAARRAAYPALEQLGATMLDDVAVPRGQLAVLIDRVEAIAAESQLTIGTFGHAGDGNLHPTIVFDAADEEERSRAQAAFAAIVEAALALGGTVTGEHGVGVLKRTQLADELGPAGLALHRRLKAALDPDGLMNPGKVL